MSVDNKQQEQIFPTERWQPNSKSDQFYFLYKSNFDVSIIPKI